MNLWHNGDSRAFQAAFVNEPGFFAANKLWVATILGLCTDSPKGGAAAVIFSAREPALALKVENAREVETRVSAAWLGARVQLIATPTAALVVRRADLVRPFAQTAH